MKKKLLIVAANNNIYFLKDFLFIYNKLFEVRIADIFDSDLLELQYQWTDIIWFEWAANICVEFSNRKKSKVILTRLHSYEYYCGFSRRINWHNIDHLILVGKNICDNLIEDDNDIKNKTKIDIIHNSVDTEKYNLKSIYSRKDIAFVSSLRHCKNLPFLIQCFHLLKEKDSEYKLHIAGDYQTFESPHVLMENCEIKHYIRHLLTELNLSNDIFFYGHIGEINNWMNNKSHIVSTSFREGMPTNILEGMSKGLMPVVHNFPGAKYFYPNKFIFNTADEFVKIILETNLEPLQYRDIVKKKYCHSLIYSNFTSLLSKYI
jgi:glycosyltransferase involved in cell wall biosynthesis